MATRTSEKKQAPPNLVRSVESLDQLVSEIIRAEKGKLRLDIRQAIKELHHGLRKRQGDIAACKEFVKSQTFFSHDDHAIRKRILATATFALNRNDAQGAISTLGYVLARIPKSALPCHIAIIWEIGKELAAFEDSTAIFAELLKLRQRLATAESSWSTWRRVAYGDEHALPYLESKHGGIRTRLLALLDTAYERGHFKMMLDVLDVIRAEIKHRRDKDVTDVRSTDSPSLKE
jgi:hypothetical protein